MSSPFKKPVVVGSGSWGTGLACLMARHGTKITILGRTRGILEDINTKHSNSAYLPGVDLPENISATDQFETCRDADLIVFVVPTSATRKTAELLAEQNISPDTVLLSCSKGIERETGKRMSEIIRDSFPDNPIAVLSGPNHAEEIARRLPAAATIACSDQDVGQKLQHLFNSERFRVYTADDIAGVELGGALKNIFAIAAGVASGLRLGDNAIAALATRSLAEMIRLGTALGGQPETFAGLAGVGDLITTCFSKHSRNHKVGLALGQGKKLSEAVEELGMVAEGVPNTQSIHEAARRVGARTPIIDIVYAMLYEDIPPTDALNQLFELTPRGETE